MPSASRSKAIATPSSWCGAKTISLSPLRAATGQAADVIDLPAARYKATGIPFVPGSSVKDVLRDARRSVDVDMEKTEAVLGPSGEPAAHAGDLIVGNARLSALPVRRHVRVDHFAVSER